ncbi:hypothetical protein JYU34_001506 [Plutella xylostella]|uniref:RNA-directed DNA polymerase n=1 Tax=Plutella xylostella TaxID=51655 RepID=A0ABQ7R458_PLUXY|nr:hypothetical protein JYU34_001506 [Plutella xylostella]
MSETTIVLEAFGGTQIRPVGKRCIKIYHNEEIFETEFIIVNQKVRPILGLSSLIELELLNNNVNTIKSNEDKNSIINKNVELFQGVGEFSEPLELHTQPGTRPVVRPPRRIPHAIKERLREKLESLVNLQIISKVEHPSSFVSNLVIREKKDGTLRICLDPKDLNEVLLREYYLIPTLEEIIPNLCNKNIFSVLDLSEGFYNIKLTKESSDLCTFNSPFGCYKFNRLPFGLSVAPEIFQKYNERAFGDIPGVIIYCDDLLLCADSEAEHDAILKQVFERAKLYNVKFNKRKFQYKLTEVKYFGHIFSKKGMKIDPERIQAIANIKSPTKVKELQIFLGMVNYLRRFVPQLADLAAPLQLLLKKNVEWLWSDVHEAVFNKLKEKISQAPVLQNFDPKLPIVIQCDTSKDGLGCCLLQNDKPVCFASRSLTSAERNFSQIEKELLSVVWATRKFHYYIYGQKCIVLNDHKPLESLLKKHIHEVPSPRLQRLKLKLLRYDLEFKYLKGKLMYIADLLSRAFTECDDTDDSYMHEVVHCVGLANYLQCTEEQKHELITETSKDSEISKVIEYTKSGWPAKIKLQPDIIQRYYKLRSELTIDENLLFFNNRLIIPKSLRVDIIKKLHEGHLGMTKLKQLARKLYYWPKIDEQLERYVKSCSVCQMYQNNNVKEPLLSHEVPSLPFSKIGVDIMELKNKNYLVMYDYFSKWLEIKHINNKTSKSIINALIEVFCTLGIPLEIVSDHVPFDSREVREFAREWSCKFTFSSPRYPQSNGMAERAVQIAKKMLKKCNDDKSDYRLALLQYRSSPVCGTNFSPAELLMSRNLRTKVPVSHTYLKPKLNKNIETDFNKIKSRSNRNYNCNTRIKAPFIVGQNIWFKKDVNINKWLPGTIYKCNDFRSYELDILELLIIFDHNDLGIHQYNYSVSIG